MAELLGDTLSASSLGVLAWLLIPLLLVSATSFLKLSVVFSALRNALGPGELPSTLVTTSLSLVLTVVIMQPLAQTLEARISPALAHQNPRGSGSLAQLWSLGSPVLAKFFRRYSDDAERSLFAELAEQRGTELADDSLLILWPAFVLTELREALTMAVLVLLPFVIIDLVVANILLALGMNFMAPSVITLPLKLLLFLSVDGVELLTRALVEGYA